MRRSEAPDSGDTALSTVAPTPGLATASAKLIEHTPDQKAAPNIAVARSCLEFRS
jgi:hypothetical protein